MDRTRLYLILVSILVWGIAVPADVQSIYAADLALESYNGGHFSIDKPKGWQVITAGTCSDFAFVIRDPSEPLRQVFNFGEVGPVYVSEYQKQLDYQYMSMGGYPVAWIEMPVVEPLSPSNFLQQFHLIAGTSVAQSFMPQCPHLENLHIISAAPQVSPIAGGSTELIRALFSKDGRLGEGLFLVTVVQLLPVTGNPGGGIAYGTNIVGITASQGEFRRMEKSLVTSAGSFSVSQAWVSNCMAQQSATYAGIRKAGRTLSEASDMIMRGWEERNRTDDIVAEKRSDAILEKERLFDPDTGEVYEFENGFYDKYDLDRNQYEMSNLQLLSGDNYDLWTTAPLDGVQHIR